MGNQKHLTVYDSDYWRRNALFTNEEEHRVKAIIPGRTWPEATKQINQELNKQLTPRQVKNWGQLHHVYAAEIITPKHEPKVDPIRESRQQIEKSLSVLTKLNGTVKMRRIRGWRYG